MAASQARDRKTRPAEAKVFHRLRFDPYLKLKRRWALGESHQLVYDES